MWPAGGADPSARPVHCTAAHSRTVLSNRYLRIYVEPQIMHVCWRPTGDLAGLDIWANGPRTILMPPAMTIAGKAYAVAHLSPDRGTTALLEVNSPANDSGLTWFGQLWAGPIGTDERGSVISSPRVTVGRIVMQPDGTIAWTACRTSVRRPIPCSRPGALTYVYSLVVHRQQRVRRLLERSRHVDPSSLSLSGNRITWSSGKRRRSANIKTPGRELMY